MANVDFPRGFIPVRYKDNRSLVVEYFDVSSTNAEIAVNDIVERRSDGFVHIAQAASTSVVGVAAQAKAANSGGTIAVVPAPGLVMLAQVDDATVNAQTDIGLNYDIVATVPSGGKSQMEIDGSTQATTATLPILIERVADVTSVAGNALGANVLVECVFNQCAYNGGGTGI